MTPFELVRYVPTGRSNASGEVQVDCPNRNVKRDPGWDDPLFAGGER
jgi:hypothetical protein